MGIGRYKRCVIARVDTGTWEIEFYMMDFQPDLHKACVEAVVSFWQNMEKGIAPDPSAKDGGNIIYLFPEATGEIAISTPEVDQIAEEMQELKPKKDAAEKRWKELQSAMQVAIGAASGIQTSVGKFTLSRIGGSVSWKAVAQELGANDEITKKHTGEGYARLNDPFRGGK
jgi:hypothetical protein